MELVDKFDNKRRPLGITRERNEKIAGEYRQAMHCWIMNDIGQFLIQKRSETKSSYPGLWGITGGGTDSGETTVDTIKREAKEELGIGVDLDKVELMMMIRGRYTYTDIYLYRANIDLKDIVMQEEEIQEVKWATYREIKKLEEEGKLADNIARYVDMLIKLIRRDEEKKENMAQYQKMNLDYF